MCCLFRVRIQHSNLCFNFTGDLEHLSCADDEIVYVSDSIYFEAPCVTEDSSGPIAFTSTVTEPDMSGQLDVETIRPNQATPYAGRQEQVTGGVRLRRVDTPQLLTSIIDSLRRARMQSHADQSIIITCQDECDDLKQQLHKTTEEKNRISGQLGDNQKQLRTLRYQDRMTESGLKSDAQSEQAKTEQLEEEYRKLQEKIVICEQENKDLSAKLQTFQDMENYLFQQIDDLKKEIRILARQTDRRLCCGTLLSDKPSRQFLFHCAVVAGSIVSVAVFSVLLLVLLIFFYPSACYL